MSRTPVQTPKKNAADKTRISFDLYDTLVFRTVAHPAIVFEIAAQKTGLSEEEARAFRAHRIAAEKQARSKLESKECNLTQIYQALGDNYRYKSDELAALQKSEIETERSVTRPMPKAIECLKNAKNSAAEVWIISDMYLPVDLIQSLLDQFGFSSWIDRLVVSHQAGASKWSGTIYKQHADSSVEWTHYGDNDWSDCQQAIKHGLKAFPVTESLPNRLEKKLNQSIRDLSRVSRLSRPNGKEEAGWNTGANLSGPFACAFVGWIARKAKQQQADKVLFLARDGQLLKRIYDAERTDDHSLPPAHYVYGSRAAWLPSLIHVEGNPLKAKERVRWYLANQPESLLKTIGLPLEEFDSLETTVASSRFWDALAEHHHLTLDYLKKEVGLEQSSTLLLVDIGWSGSMQRCLETILRSDGLAPRVVAVNYALEISPKAGYRETFVPSGNVPPRCENLYPSVIEMLLPADHGQTIGYRRNDARSQPVCSSSPIADPRLIDALQAGAIHFYNLWKANGRPKIRHRAALKDFLNYPSKAERDYFRQYRFCPLAREEQPSDTLIPSLPKAQIVKMAFLPQRRTPTWPWPEACILDAFPNTPRIVLLLFHVKMRVGKVLEKAYFVVRKRVRN